MRQFLHVRIGDVAEDPPVELPLNLALLQAEEEGVAGLEESDSRSLQRARLPSNHFNRQSKAQWAAADLIGDTPGELGVGYLPVVQKPGRIRWN